jgi:copper ion binding protein
MPAEPAFPQSLTLPVEGMSCASCVGRVERALKSVPGVLGANVNLAAGRADIQFDAGVEAATLMKAVTDLGYQIPLRSVTLAVDGMKCAGCVGGVERALLAVPGVTSVACRRS